MRLFSGLHCEISAGNTCGQKSSIFELEEADDSFVQEMLTQAAADHDVLDSMI